MPPDNSRPGRARAGSPSARAGLLLLAAALASCRDGGRTDGARPAVPVVVEPATVRDVPKQLEAIGTVQSLSTVAISSRVSGQIAAVHFREGQDVERGDLLFQIDPRPFEIALRQAEANLRRDRAQLANARVQARRYANLLARELVSREEADARRVAVRVLEATVKADAAAVENARVFLGFTQIRAPISGRTGNVLITPGNLVRADENRALVTLVQLAPIAVAFALPQRNLGEIRTFQRQRPLAVEVRAPDTAPQSGRLTLIDNAVDPATGTIGLKATFANDDRLLWPGQYVDVSLVLTTLPDAVLVPSRSVQSGQQGDYVFVVPPSGKAEMRQVRVGARFGQQVVVAQGVRGGERVVTEGVLGLVPGAPVRVRGEGGEAGGLGGGGPAVGGSGAGADAVDAGDGAGEAGEADAGDAGDGAGAAGAGQEAGSPGSFGTPGK